MRTAAVVDEWGLVRAGVELAMRQHATKVTVMASTANELFTRITAADAEHSVDIVVIGHVRDSTQQAAVRRAALLGLPVIALATSAVPAALIELCSEGAYGVLARDGDEQELSSALDSVLSGRRYIAPGLLSTMFDARLELPRGPRFDLTHRERQVLAEVASGRSNNEISERLLIGTQTVKTHLNNIYDKLGVRRRTHAVRLALSHGLV